MARVLTAMLMGALAALPAFGAVAARSPDATSVAPENPPGRLMFSRFDEATHTFLSAHTVFPDGSSETVLPLPGPEGGGRWSRSGAEIAVMTIVPDGRIGTAIISADGTVVRVLDLPDATLNAVCVVWSPDDARLACEAWDETDPPRGGLYTVRASDGGDLQRLTTPPEGTVDLPGDYSPDGARFVFKRTTEEAPGTLMVVEAVGGKPVPLSPARFEDSGRFSPDGAAVLTSADGRIVTLDLSGRELSRVALTGSYLFGPDWSPDGAWIAFSAATTGPVADVFISRPDGTDERQVTDTPYNEITIDWGS